MNREGTMALRPQAAVARAVITGAAAAQGGWQRNPAGYREIWIPRVEERSRLLVQMRPILEALDWQVQWAPRSRTISAAHATGRYRLTMQIDNPRAVVNGAPRPLEAPPRLIFSTTYVPLRFVAEVTGCRVDYRRDEVKITGPDGMALVVHLIGG